MMVHRRQNQIAIALTFFSDKPITQFYIATLAKQSILGALVKAMIIYFLLLLLSLLFLLVIVIGPSGVQFKE